MTKKQSKTPPAVRDWPELHRVVDRVFDVLWDKFTSYREAAAGSGLSAETVSRLDNYVTRYPRVQTVFALAKAAGLRLTVESRERVKLKIVG